MAHYAFKLPDVGEGVAEAEIVAWHVAPGEEVQEDQAFVDVMTDKATVEITSPVAGRVLSVAGEAGTRAAIGSVLAVLEVAGAADAHVGTAEASMAELVSPVEPERPMGSAVARPAHGAGRRAFAAPSVRRRALEEGVRLELVPGSGPAGRVTQDDLAAYLGASTRGTTQPRLPPHEDIEEVKVIGLRRKIADRMSEAKRRIPHFSYIEEIDLTELERLRGVLNTQYPDRPRLTLLPFIARALAATLPRFAQMNATYDDEVGVIKRHAAIHIGIATQTDAGLLVPVLRHAETLGIWETAEQIAQLAAAARAGKATREQLSGSTITITSLGALGGLATTPVINRPEVAIVGPNRLVERPVVIGGAIAIRRMMNLSSSFDHRVVDGAEAAEFVQALRRLLETPALLFVE